MFLTAGGSKLAGAAPMAAMFAQIGIGQWLRYLTGTIEVISAVLLLIPSLAFFGAAALASTMVGATFTHLFIIGGNPVGADRAAGDHCRGRVGTTAMVLTRDVHFRDGCVPLVRTRSLPGRPVH